MQFIFIRCSLWLIIWDFSVEGLQQELARPLGGLWAFAATSCVCKGEWNPSPLERLWVGFLLGLPELWGWWGLLCRAPHPAWLMLLLFCSFHCWWEVFASGGFFVHSLPHPLFSLIHRIFVTLWLSFAYFIRQKRKKKTQQLRFFKADWEL